MGNYIYIFCERCKVYIHIGKTSGHDFELEYEQLNRFLTKHTIYNGCVLTSLNDSVDSAHYDSFVSGTEFV